MYRLSTKRTEKKQTAEITACNTANRVENASGTVRLRWHSVRT